MITSPKLNPLLHHHPELVLHFVFNADVSYLLLWCNWFYHLLNPLKQAISVFNISKQKHFKYDMPLWSVPIYNSFFVSIYCITHYKWIKMHSEEFRNYLSNLWFWQYGHWFSAEFVAEVCDHTVMWQPAYWSKLKPLAGHVSCVLFGRDCFHYFILTNREGINYAMLSVHTEAVIASPSMLGAIFMAIQEFQEYCYC